jgi:hypothetical protein
MPALSAVVGVATGGDIGVATRPSLGVRVDIGATTRPSLRGRCIRCCSAAALCHPSSLLRSEDNEDEEHLDQGWFFGRVLIKQHITQRTK